MHPETFFNHKNEIISRLQKLCFMLGLSGLKIPDYRVEVLEILCDAINDVLEYYKIDNNAFWEKYYSWEEREKELFENSKNLEEFYKSWNGISAELNICANVVNQMIWWENYNVISYFFKNSKHIIDYGCGTAVLTVGLALKKKISGTILLLDVPNDVNKFVKYRLDKHKLTNISFINVFDYNQENIADGVICLDVLEHLPNSSDIFINKISPVLKRGGVLFMRAPWRGQLTHIGGAADNFYRAGGRKFLGRNFRELYRLNPLDINCVYRKK
ncbi:MAG: methyltransferase domain-containing protein [Candidatus Omnitrophota bacterium]